jgi:hypothetical protein
VRRVCCSRWLCTPGKESGLCCWLDTLDDCSGRLVAVPDKVEGLQVLLPGLCG